MMGSGSRLRVLRKLRSVFSPKPPRISRRGERKPVAVVVQAVVGLSNIARMLRNEQRRNVLLDPSVTPDVEEITITVKGGIVESTTVAGADGELTISPKGLAPGSRAAPDVGDPGSQRIRVPPARKGRDAWAR